MTGRGVLTREASAHTSAESDLAGLRVLVVHEWLYDWAGAERCLEQILAVFPQADLLVGVMTARMRDYNEVTRRARESWVGRVPGARAKHRWFLPLHAVAFAGYDTSGYDLVISSSHAFEKFVRAGDGTTHVCYCYSPPRFLWDMQRVYAERAGAMGRVALSVAAPAFRALDRRAARGVTRFIAISEHIARRISRCYGVTSDVVYPPVSAKAPQGATPPATEPYLVFVGRLVEYKRVDLVVQAAERLRMKLIVAGEGPERPKLEALAGPHTELRGAVSEHEAAALLTHCAAFVFAGEEDFGISLVEANAHGKPVVCFNRGGAAETMVDGTTAVMFDRQDVESICAAVRDALTREWNGEALRQNAARFSPAEFRTRFQHAVVDALRMARRAALA